MARPKLSKIKRKTKRKLRSKTKGYHVAEASAASFVRWYP